MLNKKTVWLLCNQKGQTLLIVILVMVVALTVGLSVASRSIINSRTATEEENSQRAFSAAEAGIEQAIKTAVPSTEVNLNNNASIKSVTKTDVSGNNFTLNNGDPVSKDDGADVWLSKPDFSASIIGYSAQITGNLTIKWGRVGESCPASAAIEIIVISGPLASPVSNRYVYDPCPGNRSSPNNFSSVLPGDSNFAYASSSIPISSGIVARVVPLYANTIVGVASSTPLPSQGTQIISTGESGQTVRQVTYFKGFPKLPSEFFQYILFKPS